MTDDVLFLSGEQVTRLTGRAVARTTPVDIVRAAKGERR
jgi:hypothetical protein